MKYFFRALYKSFTSPAWLASQSRATGKASTFFVMVLLILSVGTGFQVVYRQIPGIVPTFEKTVTEQVPDFTAQITGGTLSVSNIPQPYTRYFTDEQGKEFVVVVDTVTTGTVSLDPFFTSSTGSGILITHTGISSKNLSGQQEIEEKFDRIPNVSFSRTQIIQFLEDVQHRFRPGIFAVVVALTFALWGLGLLIFILLFSFIVFVFYSGMSKQDKTIRYSWKEIFTLSLFVFGLPKLVVTIFDLGFGIYLPYVVLTAMIIALMRALSISKNLTEQQNGSESS